PAAGRVRRRTISAARRRSAKGAIPAGHANLRADGFEVPPRSSQPPLGRRLRGRRRDWAFEIAQKNAQIGAVRAPIRTRRNRTDVWILEASPISPESSLRWM